MSNNALIAFLSEVFLRLSAKTPKFFVIWQWISGAVAAVTGLPDALKLFNVTLPAPLTLFENKIVAIASIVALVMAKLPTQSQVVSKDASGGPITKTDAKVLPFTAKDQLKNNKL